MRSIRAQLLGWLLPGFVVVCAGAGLGVYYSGKQAIDADLDARLGRLAGSARLALRNQMTAGTGGTRAPALKAFLAKEEFQSPGQYFQLWTSAGVTERRSPNLGNADLPRPPELTRDPIRYDGTLENGERVRVSAMRFPQSGGNPPLDFAVALSRSEGEARLSRLFTDLVIGGVGCCAVLCLLQVLALRFAMRPLARVGEQAAAMGARSLHERFAAEAMPSEIAPIVARLNDLMARLEQGFERERRFSGYLAHESAHSARRDSIRERSGGEMAAPIHANDFREIAQAAARLQQTVDSLLDPSRLETCSVAISLWKRWHSARSLRSVRASHGPGQTARVEFDAATRSWSTTLETDSRLLRIIVINLISNATEYAPPGSEVVIAATDGDLCSAGWGNPAPDLTSEDIPRLFDRLWRKDATRSDAAHAGLGLSIASSCALALGFALTAELDGSGVLQISLHRENSRSR